MVGNDVFSMHISYINCRATEKNCNDSYLTFTEKKSEVIIDLHVKGKKISDTCKRIPS